MTKLIDPKALSTEDARKLYEFFQSRTIKIWHKDVNYRFLDGTIFHFEYTVIERKCKEAKRGVRYEFINDKFCIGRGGFSEVINCIGTLRIDKEGRVRFKTPETDVMHKQSRLVKVQQHSERYPEQFALHEYSYTRTAAPYLAMKEPTLIPATRTSYLVMRKQRGDELFYILKADITGQIYLMLDTRIALTKLLLEALKEITTKGIIHGDIKPENIIADITSFPIGVQIIDFGMASHSSAPTKEQSGSVLYVAPEVMSNLYGPRTLKQDVFSLGLILALLWGIDIDNFNKRTKNWSDPLNLDYLFTTVATEVGEDFRVIIKDLLTGMLHFNSSERMTIEAAIEKFGETDPARTAPKISAPISAVPGGASTTAMIDVLAEAALPLASVPALSNSRAAAVSSSFFFSKPSEPDPSPGLLHAQKYLL